MNRVLLVCIAVLVAPSLLGAQSASSPAPVPVQLQRVQPSAVPSPQEYPFEAIKQGLETGKAEAPGGMTLGLGEPREVVPQAFQPRKDVPLTPTAHDALLAEKSIVHTENKPVTTADGRVVYTYGVGLPEIICAP